MRPLSILIADENKANCEQLTHMLDNCGHKFHYAYDAKSIYGLLAKEKIDLMLLDLFIPTPQDGFDILEFVHEHYPWTNVIMLSAQGSIPDVVYAISHGAIDFIKKPVSAEHLVTKVQSIQLHNKIVRKHKELSRQSIPMIGSSKAMQQVFDKIIVAAQFDNPALITGETGVGKELVARAIHQLSRYSHKTLISVNCGAIPSELVESELFGYEQGSFTGALKARKGYFENAGGSTILLDEISEMPYPAQAKLLRILAEGEMQKLGGKSYKVKSRIICSTNKNLMDLIAKGTFREDLYYRIKSIHIEVPPLRQRKEDIPDLAAYFLTEFAARNQSLPKSISTPAMSWLMEQEWKGNVRELRNVIESSIIFAKNDELTVADLQATDEMELYDCHNSSSLRCIVMSFEKTFIRRMLIEHKWNISQTAKELELDKSNLIKKMHYYGLEKPVSIK